MLSNVCNLTFESNRVATFIFIVLGVIGGGVTVYRQILDITKASAKDQKNPENGTR